MREYKTLSELNLTVNDFNIEIIEIGELKYNNLRNIIAKIDNIILNFSSSINIEFVHDISIFYGFYGIDIDEAINSRLKEEALIKYINSNQYIRKSKLEKIQLLSNMSI